MLALNSAGVNTVLSKTFLFNSGSPNVFKETSQGGLLRDLKTVFSQHWKDLLTLAMFFFIYPERGTSNYDITLVVQSINTLSIKQMRTQCLQASISSGRSPVPHSLA